MKKLGSVLRGLYIALIFVFLYAPVALMIVLSFNETRSAYHWEGFSFWKYEALFNNDTIMEALVSTVVLGLCAAAIATVIGILVCIGMMAMSKRMQGVVTTTANIPLLNADIVTGIALMLFFAAVVGRMSNVTLLISHVTLVLPYVVLNVSSKLRQFDMSIYHAALDLGASPAKAFFKVVLPDIFPGVLAGFLLALTISFDDFTITYFTKGQGLNTLSTMIYTNRIRGILPEYYALSALMFVAILSLILIVQIINMRSAPAVKKTERDMQK
ncbi:MAG: ABC transporter permease [Ruminococcaceae bacterium]|nr:ABC transporter permease [Oscillospiraceae bacterium]